MFSKKELFIAIGVSLFAGMGIGYSKAREKFMEALAKAALSNAKENREEAR